MALLGGLLFLASRGWAITPDEAPRHIGEQATVEGAVAASERDGDVVRLQFGDGVFSVALMLGALSNFPADAEHYYLGKTVRVTGTIQSFRGVTEMTINDPARITVVETHPAPPPPAPTAVGAPAPPGDEDILRRRIDTLEQRVQRLEERMNRPQRGVQ